MSVADLRQLNRRGWPTRYGFSVLAAALATALQFGLRALGPSRLAFEFYYPAIVLVAVVAGFGPGLLTIVLTAVTGSYFFLEPPRTFVVRTAEDLLAPTVFAFTGLLLTLITCSRSRAEQGLRESEDRYRDLVEHSQDLLCTHDLEGNILSCNPAPARILGYEVPELLKIPMRQLVAPEYREQFDRYLERIRANGADHGLLTVVARSGERRIWKYSNTLRTEGVSTPVVRGMAHDVSEQRRAERSMKLFRILVDQSSDVIEVVDPETLRFIDINGRACLDLGYTREEFLAMTIYDIDPAIDEFRQTKMREQIRDSRPVVFESIHRRKDGSTFPVEVSLIEVRLDRTYFVAVVRDISERKRADQALQQAQAELARMIRIATMGELTASIAHEINQPLTAVVAYGGAALRLLAAQQPKLDEVREAMGRMVDEVNRASGVLARIRGLLQKSPPQRVPLDVNELIREALVLTGHELLRGNIKVTTALSADVPAVLADHVQLQQVLLNLISNAVEVMCEVGNRQRELLLQSEPYEGGVLVQVRDSGRGLRPEETERIFAPFFTTKPRGIGMGLAISRSIIEAHGGHLWATSGTSYGATFQFTLPRTCDERAA